MAAAPGIATDAPSLKKEILLIDDDKINNYINQKIIHKYNKGIDVITFLEAKEALAYIKLNLDKPPDVILLDISMHGMNGWQFIEAYRKLPIKSNLHILSSSIDPDDKIQAKKEELVESFINKPLNLEKISKVISKTA